MQIGPTLRAMNRNKVRFGLIAAEIALTLAIVANCVSLIADAKKQMARESGFDDANIVSVRTTPYDPAYREDGFHDNAVKKDLEVLRNMPGVVSATNTRFLPWQGGGSSTEMRVAGSRLEMMRTQIYPVDEKIVETLGVQVIEGAGFTREMWERDSIALRQLVASDRRKGSDGLPADKFTQDVLVTQAFAQLAFGQGPFVGKMLEDTDGDLYRVIGIVDRFYNPYGWPIHEYAVFYPSIARSYEGGALYLVRTEPGQRDAVAASIEDVLTKAQAGRSLRLQTIDEVKGRFFAGKRIMASAMTGMAVMLILVTSLGVVGLASFSVAERTRQIGTRRALGARKIDVVQQFLLENWLVTTMGIVPGIVIAFALNMQLAGARLEVPLLASGVVLLWVTGLLATLAPALRAARISPAIATRNV